MAGNEITIFLSSFKISWRIDFRRTLTRWATNDVKISTPILDSQSLTTFYFCSFVLWKQIHFATQTGLKSRQILLPLYPRAWTPEGITMPSYLTALLHYRTQRNLGALESFIHGNIKKFFCLAEETTNMEENAGEILPHPKFIRKILMKYLNLKVKWLYRS